MSRLLCVVLLVAALPRETTAQFNYVRNDQQICTPLGCRSRLSMWGSCVAVAHWRGGTVFLSAGHNFEPETPEHKVVRVTIGGADANLRRWWYKNPQVPNVDFAVLHLPGRLADLLPLADKPPKPGDSAMVCGFEFDDDKPPRTVNYQGKVTSVERGEFGGLDFDFNVGVSGGPVVSDGELVGIVLHHDKYRRHRGGFQVNYDFKKSILSLFPGATFATAPPPPPDDDAPALGPNDPIEQPPAPKKLEPAPEPRLPRTEVEPRELVRGQAGQVIFPPPTNETKESPRTEAVKELGSKAGATAGAAAGTAAFGPIGGLIGGKLGGYAGETITSLVAAGGAYWWQRRKRKGLIREHATELSRRDHAERDREMQQESNMRREIEAAEKRGREKGAAERPNSTQNQPVPIAATVQPPVASGSPDRHTDDRGCYFGGNRPENPYPGATITNNIPPTAPPIAWQNVDNGFYAAAHDEARRVVGKKYPGAQEILETELSLVRQYLSGQMPMSVSGTHPERN